MKSIFILNSDSLHSFEYHSNFCKQQLINYLFAFLQEKFAGVDIRVRVNGGGHISQIYAIRQAISKALVSYYQKCEYSRLILAACLLHTNLSTRIGTIVFWHVSTIIRKEMKMSSVLPTVYQIIQLIVRVTYLDNLFSLKRISLYRVESHLATSI